MIYVVSDIHGRGDRFASILKQIKLKAEDHLYILGDVIDRNPDGIRLLRKIAKARNMTMLLGNHEYMMLSVIDDPRDTARGDHWRVRNGGDVTWNKWKHCPKRMRAELIAWLRSLPLNIEVSCGGKDWLLVHGAPLENQGNTFDRYGDVPPDYYTVWHRLTDEEPMPEGKTVVFGHTPTHHYLDVSPMQVYHGKDRIGIDCGCAYPHGRLACLRLDDGRIFYSKD